MSQTVLCATSALLIAAFAFTQAGTAQTSTGNRANGFSYQPTPGQVDAKEKNLGVRPSATSQKATNETLEQIDRDLLLKEGLSTRSVPSIKPR